ncbi:MAG: hypothetical protein H8E46_02045 [FCB group bacterium]|nr:hypothetical protein [FCB group bacterium]
MTEVIEKKPGFSGKLLFFILAVVSVGLFIIIMVYALWMAQGIGVFADYMVEEKKLRVSEFVSEALIERSSSIILDAREISGEEISEYVMKYPEVAEVYIFDRMNNLKNLFSRELEAPVHDEIMEKVAENRESAPVYYLQAGDKKRDSIGYKSEMMEIGDDLYRIAYLENRETALALVQDFKKTGGVVKRVFDAARETQPVLYSVCFDTIPGIIIGRVKFFDLDGNHFYTLGTDGKYEVVLRQEDDQSHLGFTLEFEVLTRSRDMAGFISGRSRLSIKLIGYAVIAGVSLLGLGLLSVNFSRSGKGKRT